MLCPGGSAKVRKGTQMEILEPNPGALNGIELAMPTLTTALQNRKAQDSNTRKGEKRTRASLWDSRTNVAGYFSLLATGGGKLRRRLVKSSAQSSPARKRSPESRLVSGAGTLLGWLTPPLPSTFPGRSWNQTARSRQMLLC